ncbi:MAG: hypothetical protein PHW25_14615 [Zoogloea sp.]|uniref:hypothetical protein n=1 Tax=Zoogloea sp. TaxID=49181 RepID=UPI00263569B1|nr:hypothetical protein [Zoogloea sp.]MDD3328312.1 hypothetical protein [Zoogloea sp.]
MSGIARIKDVLRKMGVPRAADDEEFIKAKKTPSGGVAFPAVGDKFGGPIPLTASVLDSLIRNVPAGLPALPMRLVCAWGDYVVAEPNDAITAMIAYHSDKYVSGACYVKPSTGVDTNDGLSPSTPFASVTKAMQTAGLPSRVVMLEDAVLAPFDLRSTYASQTTAETIKILDGNGFDVRVRVSGPDLSAQTWAQDGTYTNCWTTTLTLSGTASLTRVLQLNVLDNYGEPTPLKSYTSAAALDAALSGYYYDSAGKVLWVNLGGASVKAARGNLSALYKGTDGNARIMVSGARLGLRGVRVEGCTLQLIDADARRPEVWMHNTKSIWNHSVGVSMTNAGWCISSDTFVYSTAQDCVNATAPSATGKGLIHSLRSLFSRSGDLRIFADNATYQATSAHGGSDHVSWGCTYELANGQGIADTCTTNYNDVSWIVAAKIKRQGRASPSLEFGSASTNASRKVYLDSCQSIGPAAADLVIGTNATVYVYNTALPTITGGTVSAYSPDAPPA